MRLTPWVTMTPETAGMTKFSDSIAEDLRSLLVEIKPIWSHGWELAVCRRNRFINSSTCHIFGQNGEIARGRWDSWNGEWAINYDSAPPLTEQRDCTSYAYA